MEEQIRNMQPSVFDVYIAWVIVDYRFIINMMNTFPSFVRGSGPRISVEKNSKGPDVGNNFSFRLRLDRSRSRAHVAQFHTF